MSIRNIFSAAVCRGAVFVAWSSVALAQPANPGSDDIELGPIAPFATESSAAIACAPDVVVWTDRKTGYYYPRFTTEYGKTPRGTFTCLKGAIAADYWGWGVISNIGGHKGREFPDRFPCTQCM